MRFVIMLALLTCAMTVDLKAQEVKAIYPLMVPQTDTIRGDGYIYYPAYDIKIDQGSKVYIGDSLVYTCDFTKYYEYLFEVFGDDKLLISPMKAVKGSATSYKLDREILLIFDLASCQRFYADVSRFKKIELGFVFDHYKNRNGFNTINSIDIGNMKIVMMHSGQVIVTTELPMYRF